MNKQERFNEKLLDDNFYYSDKTHVSCSMLKHLLKSPAHLENYLKNPPKSTPAMVFGSAFHCMVLEPNKFNDNFYILDVNLRPEKEKGMTSKINKAWKAEELTYASAANKEIITMDELEKIELMCASLFKHPKVAKLISESQKEEPISWSTVDGIKCKGKLDLKSFDFIADIKTTAEFGGIDKFKYDCKKYNYDMQAAFYSDALFMDQFKFIVIGKNYPYDVAIYDVSPEFLEAGRAKYTYALEMYDKYFVSCTDQVSDYMETGVL